MVYEPIVGYAYGQKQETGKGKAKIYREVAGEDFWTMLTGDKDFYKKIIVFMGQLPEQYVDEFKQRYANASNRLVRDFSNMFCKEDGCIDWERLVEYNSGSLTRQAQEREDSGKQILLSLIANNPQISKKKLSEGSGLSASYINRLLDHLMAVGALKREGTPRSGCWVILD